MNKKLFCIGDNCATTRVRSPINKKSSDRAEVRQLVGWEFIYREDLKKLESLSPAERGLADLMAEEASLKMWHMRLVESFVAVTGSYVLEKPTIERFAALLYLVC